MKTILLAFVFVVFFVSDDALTNIGMKYTQVGGSWYHKIHPYTYLCFALLCTALAKLGLNRVLYALRKEASAVAFMLMIIIAALYLMYLNGISGTAPIIDTVFVAVIVHLIIKLCDDSLIFPIWRLVVTFQYLDCFLAVIEKIMQVHIIPREDDYAIFRSTALQGHPLKNALVVSLIGIIMLLVNNNSLNRVISLSVTLLALICFGERTALLVFVVVVSLIAIDWFLRFIFGMSVKKFDIIIAQSGILVIILVLSIVFMYTNLGDRILYHDVVESGMIRYHALRMLSFMGSDLLTGVPFYKITYYMTQNEIPVIENYIIIWILSMGLIVGGLLILSYLWFLFDLARSAYRYGYVFVFPLMCFFINVLTSNSLSTKTSEFVIMIIIHHCMIRILEKQKSAVISIQDIAKRPSMAVPFSPPVQ